MLKFFLQVSGWLVAHTPQMILRFASWTCGQAVFLLMPRRRRLFFSNLDHAFPNRTRAWQRKIARESSCRVVETLLLSLASPFLSDTRLRTIARTGKSVEALYDSLQERPRPVVYGTVHFAHWESETWLPLLLGRPMPETGVIFRPLDNASADAWVKQTRERFGLRLLSRKEGFQEALKILRRNGTIALLFDQNAGMQGALTTYFGRVCSTTELAGLLTEKFGADLYAFYPRRHGFWKIELEVEKIFHNASASGATIALNQWLEAKLSEDDDLCASWLWSHDRWRHQDMPEKRLRLESKRDLLAAETEVRAGAPLPRKTRIFVRLPNWLGDVVMALPLLKTLRSSRPDAEITLIGKAPFLTLLKDQEIGDCYESLPSRGPGYFLQFWKLRRRYPDAYLLFTNSFRGDLEAWLTRCPQRFGIVRKKRRPMLTHAYLVPSGFEESQHHQLELWENFFRAFGLGGPLERAPLHSPNPAPELTFGFIAGSENTPEKRWPVTHWRDLLKELLIQFPNSRISLFGTANDRPITAAIAADFDPSQVTDLAGQTGLLDYMAKLRSCTVLVTNDTGGMHLANALGVPLIALFGPTNPVRTGPVFSTAFEILQPPACPKTGGGSLANLSPAAVLEAIRRKMNSKMTGDGVSVALASSGPETAGT